MEVDFPFASLPALDDGSGDALGGPITNKAAPRGHNNSENGLKQLEAYQIYIAVKAMEDAGWENVMFSGTTPTAVNWKDIPRVAYLPDDAHWFNRFNGDIEALTTLKSNWLLYAAAQTGDDLLNSLRFVRAASYYPTIEGFYPTIEGFYNTIKS
jgi:hypothetical protein